MAQVLTLTRPCPLEIECPDGVHRPGPASFELAKYLFSVKGKRVLDLACGTGLYAVAAAKLGASEVWATDLDPAAVDCARTNAARNGVAIQARAGSLFEPVTDERFDLIACNPPQTPAPAGIRGPKFGGEDGLLYFRSILAEAPRHLAAGGILLTFLSSLADTRLFETLLSGKFRFRALPTLRRPFTPEEFEGYHPGLMDYLRERQRGGLAEFEDSPGACAFTVRFYMAMKLP